MLNGPTTQGKISQGGLVQKWLSEGKTPEQIIETIYIRTLTRKPTPQETEKLTRLVQESGNPQMGLEDIFWSVFNAREFIFNH